MATFAQSLIRIRRFLRDPDALVWDSEQIRIYFNDSQSEIAEKINHIEKVRAYPYPPVWTWAYHWDWEVQHIDGDKYQSLQKWGTRDMIICYPWEPGYWLDSSDTADDGGRFSQPWESAYLAPADVIPIPLHNKLNRTKFVAYDEQSIEPITERELSQSDPWYKTHSGTPDSYYRPSEYENTMVLYPRPSSIVWDTNSLLSDVDPSESFSDTLSEGIIVYEEDAFDEQDKGIIFDTVDAADHLFMIFEAIPDDVPEDSDEWDDELSSWPSYMIPMIEYATLERCFGADSEGFIPSLRDYWETRKKIGIETIKTFKLNRLTDRDFRLGGSRKPSKPAHPRLPSAYPDPWL